MTEVPMAGEATRPGKPVRITVTGDLCLRGEARSDVQVVTAPSKATVHDSDSGVDVQLSGDGVVVMPASWPLEVVSGSGDVAIRGLAGRVVLGAMAGDVALADIGSVRIASVAGDLAIRGVNGDCRIERAEDDVLMADVSGQLSIERAAGDLRLTAVKGDIAAVADGDIRAALEPAAGRTYRLEAGGSIKLSIPTNADVQLVMRSGGGAPRLRLGGPHELGISDDAYRLTLGDGRALAELTAGGRITVQHGGDASHGPAWSTVADATPDRTGEEIGRHVEERVASVTTELVDRLSQLGAALPRVLEAAGVSDHEAERIARQAEQSLERTIERVRRQTERAIARLERRLARAERRGVRAENGGRAWGFRWRGSAAASQGARESGRMAEVTTDAERLAILRLLESKRLTAAEAERLLAALED